MIFIFNAIQNRKKLKKQKSSPVANESVLRQLDCLLKSRKDESKVKE
ncbi:hypothetical protein 3S16_24 [uncultured Caudovirales phage]|uniref:Uncharacterized protein n=1 Tax=uncultured Caudovirales phage TaxID=2100421 RepID=A0A2H4JHR3_9CAUD|nr:hypothetical protein 3S16_24 [uncultured Caudovirales phage]